MISRPQHCGIRINHKSITDDMYFERHMSYHLLGLCHIDHDSHKLTSLLCLFYIIINTQIIYRIIGFCTKASQSITADLRSIQYIPVYVFTPSKRIIWIQTDNIQTYIHIDLCTYVRIYIFVKSTRTYFIRKIHIIW